MKTDNKQWAMFNNVLGGSVIMYDTKSNIHSMLYMLSRHPQQLAHYAEIDLVKSCLSVDGKLAMPLEEAFTVDVIYNSKKLVSFFTLTEDLARTLVPYFRDPTSYSNVVAKPSPVITVVIHKDRQVIETFSDVPFNSGAAQEPQTKTTGVEAQATKPPGIVMITALAPDGARSQTGVHAAASIVRIDNVVLLFQNTLDADLKATLEEEINEWEHYPNVRQIMSVCEEVVPNNPVSVVSYPESYQLVIEHRR